MTTYGLHLRRFMSLLSLALALNAAAIVVMIWVRSHWATDELRRVTIKPAYGHWESREWSFTSSSGDLEFQAHGFDFIVPEEAKEQQAAYETEPFEWRTWGPGHLLRRDNIWYQLGFTFGFRRYEAPTPDRRFSWDVTVPLWFLLVLLLAFPAWRLLVLRARSSWHRRGLCPVCGYDLRASAGRCPECGKPL